MIAADGKAAERANEVQNLIGAGAVADDVAEVGDQVERWSCREAGL